MLGWRSHSILPGLTASGPQAYSTLTCKPRETREWAAAPCLRRKQAGEEIGFGILSRIWTEDRESYLEKCALLFPPGSLLITILNFKMQAGIHTKVHILKDKLKATMAPSCTSATPLTLNKQACYQNPCTPTLSTSLKPKSLFFLAFRLKVRQREMSKVHTQIKGKVKFGLCIFPSWLEQRWMPWHRIDGSSENWPCFWSSMWLSFSKQWPWNQIHHLRKRTKNWGEMIC